jgi:hypothetical protein
MKKNTSTKIKTIVVVVIVASALSLGSFNVFAAATTSTSTYPAIVEKIAEAFDLDPAEVNEVFEAEKKEMEAKRQAQYEKRLAEAVTAGTITEAQKTAILEETAAIRTKMETIKDLDKDEQKTKMDSLRTEIQTWIKNNGLEEKQNLLEFGAFGGGPGGNGHRPGRGDMQGGAPGKGDRPMPPSGSNASMTNS